MKRFATFCDVAQCRERYFSSCIPDTSVIRNVHSWKESTWKMEGKAGVPTNSKKITRKVPKNGSRLNFTAAQKLDRISQSHEKVVSLVYKKLRDMRADLGCPKFRDSIGLVEEIAITEFESFRTKLRECISTSDGMAANGRLSKTLLSLRKTYEEEGKTGLDAQLHYMLQDHVANAKIDKNDLAHHARLADLRYPYEWYSSARELQREVHLHIGPTNSGKTYHALQRLKEASSGIYAGPLRLLAHEVYRTLIADGKQCDLITGDERIIDEHGRSALSSCTVEMIPIGVDMDVAVIDEIQMIGHNERGWAWTQAFLGIRAKEVHLCGEERALPLVRDLAIAVGDTLHIHRYKRLSPLKTMSNSLEGDLKKLRKGDCLVVFSRRGIHIMKQEIERITGKKVAVVYGSLPPETRTQQARLFNDPSNEYDILVASDAVGMGLNLNIKRIIFETTTKIIGDRMIYLSAPDIKQIAGRAGRFRVAPESKIDQTVIPETANDLTRKNRSQKSSSTLGLVTSLDKVDLPVIHRAMMTEPSSLISAGILPPDNVVIRFASYFPPQTPFSYILLRLYEISKMHSRFHICRSPDTILVANAIQNIKGLSIADRLKFCASPASLNEVGMAPVVKAFAKCVELQSGGALLDLDVLNLSILDRVDKDSTLLRELELLHKGLVLYLWLSYRFSGIFVSQAMAFHVKSILEDKINIALTEDSHNHRRYAWSRKLREIAILQGLGESTS